MSAPSYYNQVAGVLRDVSPLSPLVLPSTALILINAWEHVDGIPISIVERAIRAKAARHATGAGARGVPLKLEWCADDVQLLFADWKRATGAMAASTPAPDPAAIAAEQLRRARARLEEVLKIGSRSETFLSIVQWSIVHLMAQYPRLNQPTLAELDKTLVSAGFAELTPAEILTLRERVAHEMQPFRDRLSGVDYERAASLKSDQLVREQLGLPTLSDLAS